MKQSIITKLEGLVERYEEVQALLSDPGVISDQDRFRALSKEYSDLEEIWKAEKAVVQGTQHIKEELDICRTDMETARRAGDIQRMSELQYGRIPELEKQLEEATLAQDTDKENQLLRNKVTENEIADHAACPAHRHRWSPTSGDNPRPR